MRTATAGIAQTWSQHGSGMPEACSFYLLNWHWALVPAGFETYIDPCFLGTSSAGMSAGAADKSVCPTFSALEPAV